MRRGTRHHFLPGAATWTGLAVLVLFTVPASAPLPVAGAAFLTGRAAV